MGRYKCEFTVNGVRSSLTVSARTSMDAKKLIAMQYEGCTITWWSVTRV